MSDIVERLEKADFDTVYNTGLIREATEEIQSLRKRVEKLEGVLVNLNSELDAYWNDHSQAGRRPPEVYIQNITNAQIASRAALEE